MTAAAVVPGWTEDPFGTALRLGGTLTGEHGVGLLKRRWLGDELGPDVLDLQRDLKAVFAGARVRRAHPAGGDQTIVFCDRL